MVHPVSPRVRASPPAHTPVLLAEALQALQPANGETYIDGTFGAGGYSQAILDAADCRVVGFDRDPNVIANAAGLVAQYKPRLTLLHERFSQMRQALQALSITHVDGIVLDIGVSSMQIDQGERGFSFLREGPLDMRMSASGTGAADVVNTLSKEELADILFYLGEERRSRAISAAIVAERATTPLATTSDLVRVIERAIGAKRPGDRIHPATRSFQALRIYVNDELEELATALHQAEQMLRPGGRLVVVSFHSLEDRMVKLFLNERAGRNSTPSRHQLVATAPLQPSFELISRGAVEASEDEISRNPRARSAKLRAARRSHGAPWPGRIATPLSHKTTRGYKADA